MRLPVDLDKYMHAFTRGAEEIRNIVYTLRYESEFERAEY